MASPRYTKKQIELAVDYIAHNRAYVYHPEDRPTDFASFFSRTPKKFSEQEEKARDERAAKYIADFKHVLIDYWYKMQMSCIRSDYSVNHLLCNVIDNTNVCFQSGFWEVNLTGDGKVFSCVGKYDFTGKEVLPKSKAPLEESKAELAHSKALLEQSKAELEKSKAIASSLRRPR